MARRTDSQNSSFRYDSRPTGERPLRARQAGSASAQRQAGEQPRRALSPREKVEQASRLAAQQQAGRLSQDDAASRARRGAHSRAEGNAARQRTASPAANDQRAAAQRGYSEDGRAQRQARSAGAAGSLRGERSQRAAEARQARSTRVEGQTTRRSHVASDSQETRTQRQERSAQPGRTQRQARASQMEREQRQERGSVRLSAGQRQNQAAASSRTSREGVDQRATRRSVQQRRPLQASEDGSTRRQTGSVQDRRSSERQRSVRDDETRRARAAEEQNNPIIPREAQEAAEEKLEAIKATLSDKEAVVAGLSGAKDKVVGIAGKIQKSAKEEAAKKSDEEHAPREERTPFVLPAFFLGLIAALLVLGIALPDADFSETENRNLQTLPELSVDTFADGTFQSEFQTYIDDQFPFRDLWVSVKSVVSTLAGQVENNGVYRCDDGTLILGFTEPEEDKAAEAVVEFTENHEDLNIYTLIAPTAAGIWKDKLPSQVVMPDQKAYLEGINKQFSAAGAKVVDVWKGFEAKKDFDLYYRTDHHWTTYGAQLAYMNLANAMDINASSKTYNDLIMTSNFSGSLVAEGGYFLSSPEELHVYLRSDQEIPCVITYVSEKTKTASPYVSSALDQRDAYQVFFGGNHAQIQIDCYAENSKGTLLIVKDSYANSLIPFLIGDYERIIVIDPRYYTGDLESVISSNNVNDVLFLYNATTFASDVSLKRTVDAGLTGDATSDN